MRVAIIKNDIVENIIKADQSFLDTTVLQYVVLDEGNNAKIGDTYVDEIFTTPAPVPEDYEDYTVLRERAYPKIGDQLDDLYHAMDTEEIPKATAFYNAIKAVKDTYPKPA